MNKNLLRIFLISIIVFIGSNNIIAQNRPVNVTDFTISTKAQKVIIDWKTDGTSPTNYFAIQKSTDGVNYRTVALVLGPDPKEKSGEHYAGFDKYVAETAKHSYYRLVHVDTNGNEQITEAKPLAKP